MSIGLAKYGYNKGYKMFQQALKSVQFLIIVIAASLLQGCGGNAIDVTAKFDSTRDIEKGAVVYFQDRAVGEVASVSPHQAGSMVKFEINQEDAAQISSESAVVVNRVKPGAPLEIHNPAGEITTFLQPGQSIEGMDSMLELMAWSLGDALHESSKGVTEFISGFQDYLKSDEFQSRKSEFQEQMTEAGKAAGEALKHIEEDVTKALQDMATSEQHMADAIDQLGEELSPMVEEIARAGAELSVQIEEFAQRLEEATPEQRESGQQLIESMTRMLEKMNESMEKGAAQGEKEGGG